MYLDIMRDVSKIREDHVRSLFKQYQVKFPVTNIKKTDKIIITTQPLIKFTEIPLIVSNTLYELHPKEEEEKIEYLTYRYLSIVFFQYYFSETSSYIQAAKMVCDIFLEIINDFNDFDYYLEFMFLKEIKPVRTEVLSYILKGLFEPQEYQQLQKQSNPFTTVKTTVNIGKQLIERFKYIIDKPGQVYIKKDGFVIQVPVEVLMVLDSEEYETYNMGHREVGTHDKAIQTRYIRNSLKTLFVPLSDQPNLVRLLEKSDPDHQEDVLFFKTALSITFDEKDETSFIYIYQMMSTFLPLTNIYDTIRLDQLGSWRHDLNLYQQKVGMKFNQVHHDEVVDFSSFSKKITLLNLSPNLFSHLEKNLKELEIQLPKLFKMPELAVEYFGFQFKDPFFNEIYNHYHELLGGHQGMISSNKLLHGEFPISFTIIRGKDTGYLQIHSKRKFGEKYRDKISMKKATTQIIRYSMVELRNMVEVSKLGDLKDEFLSIIKQYAEVEDMIIK